MKAIINIGLAAASLVLSAVLIEGGFYVLNRFSPPIVSKTSGGPDKAHEDFFQYDPVYGFRGIANKSGMFGRKFVSLNSRGDRGPDYLSAKSAGIKRVIVLGDSQVWGFGMADNETAPAQLAEILTKDAPQQRFEVLNLGVSGYGTDQEYLKFVIEGLTYQPDYVALVFYIDNDITEVGSTRMWGVAKPRFFLRNGGLCLTNFPPPRAEGWRDPGSKLFGFLPEHVVLFGHTFDLSESQTLAFFKNRQLRTSLAGMLGAPSAEKGDALGEQVQALKRYVDCVDNSVTVEKAAQPEALEVTYALIEKMAALSNERGVPFLVIMKPAMADYRSGQRSRLYREISNKLAGKGIPVVDLISVGRRNQIDIRNMYWHADGHLGVAGNRMVALSIRDFVLEKALP